MASNARNLSKLLGTSTQVPTTALPPAIADLETVGQTLSGGEIAPSSIKSNTLTQSFDSNQAVAFNMADSIDAVSPIVSVFKEVPQSGFSSKGQWDVNANATNYEFFDEKPISYSSATLTPSATGDGTFTSSNPTVSGYDISLISSGYVRQINSWDYTGAQQTKSAEFSSNGTKIYFCETNSDKIKVFSLSTAFDITTIAGTASSEYTLSLDPYAVRVNSAGTKLWVGYDSSIEQFTLGTAHDLSTATSDGTWTVGTYIRDIRFNNDGTKIYIADFSSDDIKQYSLTTAYDITGTKTLDGSITGLTNPTAILFNNDGSKLYYGKDADNDVFVKNLGTVYDITTNVSDGTTVAYDSSANANNWPPKAMAFNSDGTRLFILHIYNTSPFHRYLSEFTSGSTNAFNAADVGKKVVGNSGSAIITATSGTYTSVTPFADTSTISSWQLFGAQGKADGSGIELSGFSSSYGTIYGKSLSDVVNHTTDAFNSVNFLIDFVISPDGTKLFYTQYNDGKIYERAISTAWDLSTISLTDTISGGHLLPNAPATYIKGFTWSTDGMKLYVVYSNSSTMAEFYNDPNYPQYAFRVDTLTYAGSNKTLNTNLSSGNTDIIFKNDGTMVFISNGSTPSVYSWPLSTAWDLSTAGTRVQSNINFSSNYLQCLAMSADGTSMIVENETNDNLQHFTLSTPFDITTMTETSQTHHINTVITGSMNSGANNPNAIQWADNGNRFFVYTTSNGGSLTSTNQKAIYQFSTGSATHPYSTYSPALTNSSNGQINSSAWQDINSMTADETKNDGDVFYAVSTDNRTSWGVAKASDGVRKIVKNNSGTWQYNNDAGSSSSTYYNADGATYNSAQNISNQVCRGAMYFNSSGTKSIKLVQISGYSKIRSYTYTTPYDLTTESYSNETFDPAGSGHSGLYLKPDGTKFYVTDYGADQVIQYNMSTAFDPSSATAGGNGTFALTSTGAVQNNIDRAYGIEFKPDGTRMYVADGNQNGGSYMKYVQYDLSTPWDVTTASHAGQWVMSGAGVRDLAFWPDGTKVLAAYDNGTGSNVRAQQYTLSVAWDITSTMTDTGHYLDIGTNASISGFWGGKYAKDGELFIIGSGDGIYVFNMGVGGTTASYGTSETWVNGTNNNEHATLQQALTSQSFNRMNKAQLDAVADGYHFSQDSADTLDLMIAPYAASGTSPISDGVTINYDAEALIREAIPGTDYIAEFPNPTTLNITAVGAANLKIRAQ